MTASLAEYYATNYSRCQNIDDSFLSSWQGLAYPTHAIQVIGFPVQVLTTYLISKKSAKVMKSIKGPLMMAHFWISLCDFSLCTLVTPYYFLPHIVGFNVGVLSLFHIPVPIQLILICLSLSAMVTAIIALFENRSSSIAANKLAIRGKRSRIAYYTANIGIQLTTTVLLFLKVPEDQELAKLKILDLLPCPTHEFFTAPTYVITTDPEWNTLILYFFAPANAVSALLQGLFHCSCCVYYLYFSSLSTVSPQTRRLQRQYFLGLVLQCSIPFTVFAVPYSIAFGALLIGRFTQGMMNMLITVFGLHGIAESIAVIVVHKSYRASVKQMFIRQKPTDLQGVSKEVSGQVRNATVLPTLT